MISFKRQRGLTLVEAIAAVVIGIVVLAGIAGMFSMSWRATRSTAMINELTQVVAAMSGKYGAAAKTTAAPYTSAGTADVLAGVPEYANAVTNTVTTPFASPLVVAASNLFGTAGDSYSITVTVPIAACADVITQQGQTFDAVATATAANYIQLPKGTTVSVPSGVTPGAPPTPAQISTACGAGAGNIVLFFYKV